MPGDGGLLEQLIRQRLEDQFSPGVLRVVNQSHLHRGHLLPEEETGETHFEVSLYAQVLLPLSRIERQRQVYAVFSDLFENRRLHALSIRWVDAP